MKFYNKRLFVLSICIDYFLPLFPLMLISMNAASAESDKYSIINNISRFQIRQSIDSHKLTGGTLSAFYLTKSKIFALGIVDYEKNRDSNDGMGRAELNVGGSIDDSPFGWVVRGKYYYQGQFVGAAGAQFNFNSISFLQEPLRKMQVHSFMQLMRSTNDHYFGRLELLHYFAVEILPRRFTVRGNNTLYITNDRKILRHSWADFIYSINRKYDVYYRLSYVNKDNDYLGKHGTTQYIGFRFNWE